MLYFYTLFIGKWFVQKSRRINDYLQYIYTRKGVEPFYEAIVQYGDINTASCESETGKKCQEMLKEYMNKFQNRNPNLYVFNAVMHLDEATPHLHIDFIPYYTKGKKLGLSKGVSMRSALDEQGFSGEGKGDNRLIKFEKAERDFMEQILNSHGMEREDKYAHYDHMTVDAYKAHKDIESYKQHLNNAFEIADNVKLQTASIILENQNLKLRLAELKKVEASPYILFLFIS